MINFAPHHAPSLIRLEQLFQLIEEPARTGCLKLLKRIAEDDLRGAPGSSHNHQAWPGGYLDHVAEVMEIAVRQHAALTMMRPLPFTLSDALLVLFLHDLEKPWKYEKDKPLFDKVDRHAFRMKKIAKYGIALSADHVNAIRYVEGELDDYSPKRRVMGRLAAFCHACDVLSARLWFDEPQKG